MKTDIEVVAGFLEAGKSAFINAFLKVSAIKDERIGIIQMEHGKTSINFDEVDSKNIKIINCSGSLLDTLIKAKKENFHRVIIEWNGTEEIKELYDVIYNVEIRKRYSVRTMYYVIDGCTCISYIRNMGELLLPYMGGSNLIIINNTRVKDQKIKDDNIQLMEQINLCSHILSIDNFNMLDEELKNCNLFRSLKVKTWQIKIKDYFCNLKRVD